MLVTSDLHGIYSAFLTAEKGFLDVLGRKVVFHVLAHLGRYMGIAAEGIAPDNQAGDFVSEKVYNRQHGSFLPEICVFVFGYEIRGATNGRPYIQVFAFIVLCMQGLPIEQSAF